MTNWQFFYGNGTRQNGILKKLINLEPPPWRKFSKTEDVPFNCQRWRKLWRLAKTKERDTIRGQNFRIPEGTTDIINAVNAAIYLRRPLLVTGKPGSGKTTLAYAVAYELKLGPVLSWAITARSTLQEGLYRYDAIARLQDSSQKEEKEEHEIGKYITLGALGTSFLPSTLPRVLLIDEIDKSDINLPNDLLNLFEEGEFPITELVRRSQFQDTNEFKISTQDQDIVSINGGRVRCHAFPIIIMTSNGERDFPPAFKRRCLRVNMPDPNSDILPDIVKAHFGQTHFQKYESEINDLIQAFTKSDKNQPVERATDQLLNTIYILTSGVNLTVEDKKSLQELLFKRLNSND